MPRLHIPVRYGSEIKDIEFTKFLELSDTVKPVLSLPVGIRTPVKDKGIAAGKLLRCGNNGALLEGKNTHYKNYEQIIVAVDNNNPVTEWPFAQKVYGGCLWVIGWSSVTNFYWTDSGGIDIYQVMSDTQLNWLNFVGNKICFAGTFINTGYVAAYMRGFY